MCALYFHDQLVFGLTAWSRMHLTTPITHRFATDSIKCATFEISKVESLAITSITRGILAKRLVICVY